MLIPFVEFKVGTENDDNAGFWNTEIPFPVDIDNAGKENEDK